MRWKLLDKGPPATHAVVLDSGDEAVAALGKFAREHRIEAAALSAIGAFERAVVGYFDWSRKDYKRIPVDEQVEVLSLLGDVAISEGEPALHIHAVLGRSDGSVVGGHLLEGHVRPTLEVVFVEPPAHLRKRKDPETGLALISIERAES
ncbi:MAG TPA: PPC domain-containing DNA-binding protein [Stellaceae bacterium]|nr:PPC domain-containing DNA-binding protein [Stellaceae bacterium]